MVRRPRGESSWTGASPAELRAAVHACLAKLLLAPPSADVVSLLQEVAEAPALPAHLKAAGLDDVASAWSASAGGEGALAQEWNDLFRVPLERHVAPYESVHAPRDGEGRGSVAEPALLSTVTASLRELYEAAGYDVDPGIAELPDHAGMELGFLACLVAHEAAAEREGDGASAEAVRASQAQFLSRHPARWLGTLADRVDEKASLPFYRCVTRAAARVTEAELHALR